MHQSELDALIGQWTAGQQKHELVVKLQAAGVPAAAVQHSADLLEDQHLASRGFYATVGQPSGGEHRQRT